MLLVCFADTSPVSSVLLIFEISQRLRLTAFVIYKAHLSWEMMSNKPFVLKSCISIGRLHIGVVGTCAWRNSANDSVALAVSNV